jgi:hypothetical protein
MRNRDVVFFAMNKMDCGLVDLSIVSEHLCIEVTLIHQTWELRGSGVVAKNYLASNSPLETATYAETEVVDPTSPEELIAISGQNATQLMVDISKNEIPCLLTTGSGIETYRSRIQGTLAIETWADTADFQAEQRYWIDFYQKRIDSGEEFLRPRLIDFDNERLIAQSIRFKIGDRLPVNFENNGTLCVGCLVFESIESNSFQGQLFLNREFDSMSAQLDRNVVSDDGTSTRCLVASNIRLLPFSE